MRCLVRQLLSSPEGETVATALVMTMWNLGRHPAIYEQLVKQLEDTYQLKDSYRTCAVSRRSPQRIYASQPCLTRPHVVPDRQSNPGMWVCRTWRYRNWSRATVRISAPIDIPPTQRLYPEAMASRTRRQPRCLSAVWGWTAHVYWPTYCNGGNAFDPRAVAVEV